MTSALTTVILTLNESERIARCLRSLKDLGRVVIVDSHSSDNTLEVARKTWIDELKQNPDDLVLITQTWKGFTQMRNDSFRWVTTPWVLWLDADEWLEPALQNFLKTLPINNLEKAPALYSFRRQSYFLGRAIRHGGWYPDQKKRLSQSKACKWSSGPNASDVHEDLYVDSSWNGSQEYVVRSEHIEHEPFRNEEEQQDTNRKYSQLLAEGLAKKLKADGSSAPSIVLRLAKPPIKFLENYIFKLGILDGLPGFKIAWGSAQSMKMRLDSAARIYEKLS